MDDKWAHLRAHLEPMPTYQVQCADAQFTDSFARGQERIETVEAPDRVSALVAAAGRVPDNLPVYVSKSVELGSDEADVFRAEGIHVSDLQVEGRALLLSSVAEV